jgi:hypothetical protein
MRSAAKVLGNLRFVKRSVLPAAVFGAAIGVLESVIKGGAARAIFVTFRSYCSSR